MAENSPMNNDDVVVVAAVNGNGDDSGGSKNIELETAKTFAKHFIEEQFAQEIAEKMSTFDQETMDLKIRAPTTTNGVVAKTTPTVNGDDNVEPVQNGDDHLLNNNVPTVTVTMAEDGRNPSESDEFVDANDSVHQETSPATCCVTMEETIPEEEPETEEKHPESSPPMTDVIEEEEPPVTNVTNEEIVQQYPVTDVTMEESVPEPLTTTDNATAEETVPESPATNEMTMEESFPVTSST
ncbi:hypothetical protein BLA29_007437, partial [Euroglyphus maynei]